MQGNYFSNAYFDKVFLTMDGISLTRGFSVLDDVTARIFQPLLKHATEIIVCATGSKFGKRAMAPLGPLTIATLWYFNKGERVHYPAGNIAIG